jgi:hypothetical protein
MHGARTLSLKPLLNPGDGEGSWRQQRHVEQHFDSPDKPPAQLPRLPLPTDVHSLLPPPSMMLHQFTALLHASVLSYLSYGS